MRTRTLELKVAEPPTVSGAIDRVVDAAQHVVTDQLDLARIETLTAARRLLGSGVLFLIGSALLLGAWATLAVAAYHLLEPQLAPVERLLVIAAANAVVGLCMLLGGVRAGKP
jgi:hypothetical protein